MQFVLSDPSSSPMHGASVGAVFQQSNKAWLDGWRGERYKGHFAAIRWKLASHHEHTPRRP